MLTPRTTGCMACSTVLILLCSCRLRKHWWHSWRSCLLTTVTRHAHLSRSYGFACRRLPDTRPNLCLRRLPPERRDCTLHVPLSNQSLHSANVATRPEETSLSFDHFTLSPSCDCDLLDLKLSHMRSLRSSATQFLQLHIEGYPPRIHDLLLCHRGCTQIQRCAFNRVNRTNLCACVRLRCRRRHRARTSSLLIPNKCSSIFGLASLSSLVPDLPFTSFPFQRDCP